MAGGVGSLRPLRHRLPPRPGEDLGRRPSGSRARRPVPLRAVRRGARRIRDRGRGLDGGSPQARRRDLSVPSAGRDVRRGGRVLRPLLGRARAGSGRLRLRRGARVPRRSRRRADLRLRSPPAADGAGRAQRPRPGGARGSRGGHLMALRVGTGYDSHRLVEGERLVIGGVEIEHDRGLTGHSDADVLTHAVIDALLGAFGLGDLGELFPDTEAEWKNADSIDLLRVVVGRLPGAVINVDVTVICEEPKLAPYKREMSSLLTGVLSAPVSVKASTNEGMGAIGRGEGIACIAVALVDTGEEYGRA